MILFGTGKNKPTPVRDMGLSWESFVGGSDHDTNLEGMARFALEVPQLLARTTGRVGVVWSTPLKTV